MPKPEKDASPTAPAKKKKKRLQTNSAEFAISGQQHLWAGLRRPCKHHGKKTRMTKGPTESLVAWPSKASLQLSADSESGWAPKNLCDQGEQVLGNCHLQSWRAGCFQMSNWTRHLLPSAFPWIQIWYGTIWRQRLASANRLSHDLTKFYTCSHVMWHSTNLIYEITQSLDLRGVLLVWPFSFWSRKLVFIRNRQHCWNEHCNLKYWYLGTSLAVQCLRLHASTAGGIVSILGWGTKIPYAMQCRQKVFFQYWHLLLSIVEHHG